MHCMKIVKTHIEQSICNFTLRNIKEKAKLHNSTKNQEIIFHLITNTNNYGFHNVIVKNINTVM